MKFFMIQVDADAILQRDMVKNMPYAVNGNFPVLGIPHSAVSHIRYPEYRSNAIYGIPHMVDCMRYNFVPHMGHYMWYTVYGVNAI